jgi:hypothetical protein
MITAGFHERHLTTEEIVARVFPVHEGAAPVPLHLSVCAECQGKVARLREAWILDKGGVQGVMEGIPPSSWGEQRSAILARVRDEAASASAPAPFPLRWTVRAVRQPAIAAASLAAALVLVAGLSFFRHRGAVEGPGVPVASGAPAAGAQAASPVGLVSAADLRDDELLQGVEESLSQDIPFRSLIPEEV